MNLGIVVNGFVGSFRPCGNSRVGFGRQGDGTAIRSQREGVAVEVEGLGDTRTTATTTGEIDGLIARLVQGKAAHKSTVLINRDGAVVNVGGVGLGCEVSGIRFVTEQVVGFGLGVDIVGIGLGCEVSGICFVIEQVVGFSLGVNIVGIGLGCEVSGIRFVIEQVVGFGLGVDIVGIGLAVESGLHCGRIGFGAECGVHVSNLRIVGGIGEAGHGGWNSRSVLNFGVLVNGLGGFLGPCRDGRVGFGGDEDAQVWLVHDISLGCSVRLIPVGLHLGEGAGGIGSLQGVRHGVHRAADGGHGSAAVLDDALNGRALPVHGREVGAGGHGAFTDGQHNQTVLVARGVVRFRILHPVVGVQDAHLHRQRGVHH